MSRYAGWAVEVNKNYKPELKKRFVKRELAPDDPLRPSGRAPNYDPKVQKDAAQIPVMATGLGRG